MGKRSLQDASPVDLETACRDHADALRAITRKAREDEADLAQDACLRLVETAQRERSALLPICCSASPETW